MLVMRRYSVGSPLLVLSLLIGCKDGGTGPAADYTLTLAPVAVTIVQGANGPTTVTLTRTNFTGAVTLNLGNAPAGITGWFTPAAPTETSSTLTVSVGAAVAPGVYNLTVTGTGTAGDRSTPLTLAVSAAPDYALSLDPAELTIRRGASSSTTVTITRTNFTGAVTLSLGNTPAGVTGSFTPATPTGTSAKLTVSVGAAVAPGVYNLTVDGTGTAGNRSTPLTLTANSGTVMTADVGSFHSCALNPSGQAYCWGDNYYGKVGDGTSGSFSQPVPTPVAGGLTFAALSGGGDHSCGVTTSGVAYCWGYNNVGELGDGTIGTRLVPTRVAGDLTFAAVSAGGGHTCGLTPAGAAYCWGVNWAGQLGTGTEYGPEVCPQDGGTACSTVPVAVAGGLTFVTVSAGDFHTCGVTTSGQAYCWGYNNVGELGDGTIGLSPFPTPVAGGLTFAAVSAGGSEYTCGVTTSGQAYCWGWNGEGELGDGTFDRRLVPTPVAEGLTFAALSAGYAHTCGVATSGAAYCWGWGRNGQLGDGTATGRLVPTAVAAGLRFAALSGGTFHTCGVTTSGQGYCWGGNANGQLGDGTTNDRRVPSAVAFP